ncbi:hypothetical protein G3N56_13185 [Desulfovibrio sulfodismutans]|uniref:Lipoprotein n=1 Tax=Desulfolutivibrio sulfodismutans TaxID=63561 RepID=A0A7K3NNB4_9BACT|nr:hypothetical protein [Desulfolutivibrio sulfodismutans]NDY57684.1 hypothetical protein [Desulfolutivibrio sulfodismutans]QLA12265.1 hypothetical protein GD606_08255 [Desulfolutivibrio sulfodismutans DSM 3696]
MRKMITCGAAAILALLAVVSCAKTDPRMTLGDFMSFCVSDASDNCRDVCDEFAGVFVVTYPTSAECRLACDKVERNLTSANISGDACESSIGRAADLCAQYCDKNK